MKKILRYIGLGLVILAAVISIIIGNDGWFWQATAILWVLNYGLACSINDNNESIIETQYDIINSLHEELYANEKLIKTKEGVIKVLQESLRRVIKNHETNP